MATWVHDDKLKEAMSRYVQQSLQRSEILDFLTRDFPQYPWSIWSLDRRLRHFEITTIAIVLGLMMLRRLSRTS